MLHQVARFSSVVPLIEEVAPGELLDVGSGSEGVASWLGPEWRVTAVDVSFVAIGAMAGPHGPADRMVAGDVTDLPFGDDSFDVALALDVLEHIPPADRARAIDELVRTTRRRVIVACPTGQDAFAADRRLAARLRGRGMRPPGWLVEHEANGFPERDDLHAWLAESGQLRLIATENVRWHELLFRFEARRPGSRVSRMVAELVAAGMGARGIVRRLSRMAAVAAQGPDRSPGYRTIAVLDLDA